MELKYVIMTIIKILISIPTIVMVTSTNMVNAAVLMGGHLDNSANISNLNTSTQEMIFNKSVLHRHDEVIPDPSALVVPGYNLPENIFNKGKPFYLEKDPLTGMIDFNSKSALVDVQYDEEFEYADDEQDPSIYEKSNIDRKDGNIGSHNTDVNQLTSNFHDFLNLPVKYNPEKYVYPLISSSYANTKVQGNIHQYNHKNYEVTTYKPTVSPTYYFTPKPIISASTSTKQTPSSTPRLTTTTKRVTTAEPPNLIGAMNHQSFYYTTEKPFDVSTNKYKSPTTTISQTITTRRPLGFFEQLFGEYDDLSGTETPMKKPPSLFQNLPNIKNKKYEDNKILPNEYEYVDETSSDPSPVMVTKQPEPKSTSITSTSSTTTTAPTTTTRTTPKVITVFATDKNPLIVEGNDELYPDFEDTTTAATVIVTSLPLGENHFPPLHSPVITVTNLKEKLNNEKVAPKPFAPSSNSVRVPVHQDTVSFVVGNHQKIVGSSFKAGAYDVSPFKPLIVQANHNNNNNNDDMVSYSVQATPTFSQTFHAEPKVPELGGMSSITIQPVKNSEASLSIGVPLGDKKIPGKVEDAKLDTEIEFPKKGTGAKIIFPDEVETKHYNLTPPANREILQLNSQPMYHQLPSDLTPPSEEQDLVPPPPPAPRPPWDPRPGHFYNGRPEYSRPPRPPASGEIYKRIDKLPNILPQFRPNVKTAGPHYYDHAKNGYMRQPLLDRPSNRPVGFFEKLTPPPPPPKNIQNLRKVPPNAELDLQDQYDFYQYQTPPQPVLQISNRRISDPGIETLQMIQSKKLEKASEKPVYVVYPVNSPPIKLDVLDVDKKETVVVGTRAESPLPPSKINHEFNYESPKDRNDAPVLKPHPKPSNFPIKSDFPYALERPGNKLEDLKYPAVRDPEARIMTDSKINYKSPNQISVTLKTFTEKPIAIAYSPTEPFKKQENTDKYSMPNYAGPVISEIRPDSEITVSAVMHAESNKINVDNNRKTDFSLEPPSSNLGFQAPFQASMNVDAVSPGWTVVRNNDKTKIDRSDQDTETTTNVAVTSEFDIENFKPQLFSGFKPIYKYPDEDEVKTERTDERDQESH